MKFDLHNLPFLAGGAEFSKPKLTNNYGFCPGLYILRYSVNWDQAKQSLPEFILGQTDASSYVWPYCLECCQEQRTELEHYGPEFSFSGYSLPLNLSISYFSVPSSAHPVGVTDPHWNDVSLLIQSSVSNPNLTTFTDSSSSPHTITANGSISYSDCDLPFLYDLLVGDYEYPPPSTGQLVTSDPIGADIKFGGDGDYLSVPNDNSDFDFGTGAFTIEGWFFIDSLDHSGNSQSSYSIGLIAAMGDAVGTADNGWVLYTNKTGGLWFQVYSDETTSTMTLQSAAATLQPQSSGGGWYHIAVSRDGAKVRLFVDGVIKDEITDAGVNINYNQPLTIGRYYSDYDHYYFKGRAQEIRISKGIARYTASFSGNEPHQLPTKYHELRTSTADSYTKLLIHRRDLSRTFTDSSSNGFNVSRSDEMDVRYNHLTETFHSVCSPKFGHSSLRFTRPPEREASLLLVDGPWDSQGNWRTVSHPNHDQLNLGTEDFTIEAWIKMSSVKLGDETLIGSPHPAIDLTDGYGGIISKWGTNTGQSWAYNLYVWQNRVSFVMMDGIPSNGGVGIAMASNIIVNDDQWHHVAVTRSGSNFKLFIDGIIRGAQHRDYQGWAPYIAAPNNQPINQGGALSIGSNWSKVNIQRYSSMHYNTYIDDIRITKGVNRYDNPLPFDTQLERDIKTTLTNSFACTEVCEPCNYNIDRFSPNQFREFCPATPSGFAKQYLDTALEDACGDHFTQQPSYGFNPSSPSSDTVFLLQSESPGYFEKRILLVPNGYDGFYTFEVNNDGSLTELDHDDQGAAGIGSWSDGNYIYLANGDVDMPPGSVGGIHSYSINSDGDFTHIDTHCPGCGATNYQGVAVGWSVWGNGKFVFLADWKTGLHSYSVDDSGNLTHLDNHYTTVSNSGGVWGASTVDAYVHVTGYGDYIFVSNYYQGLLTYSVDSSGQLTLEYQTNAQSPFDLAGMRTWCSWSDQDFVFVATDDGLHTFTVDSSGHLTLKDVDDATGHGAIRSVWGDGDYIYAAALGIGAVAQVGKGVYTYTVDRSGGASHGTLTRVKIDTSFNKPVHIWGDEKFIYIVENHRTDYEHLLYVCTSDSSGNITIVHTKDMSVSGSGGIGAPWTGKINSSFWKNDRFYDSSSTPHTITKIGDPEHSDTKAKFGMHSIHFDGGTVDASSPYCGTNGDILSVPASADWNFGTEDFTIEFWMNSLAVHPIYRQHALSFGEQNTTNPDANLEFKFNDMGWNNNGSGGVGLWVFWNGRGNDGFPNGTWIRTTKQFCDGNWHHIALTRKGDLWSLFVDGNIEGTATDSWSFDASSHGFLIGAQAAYIGGACPPSQPGAPYHFDGYLEDIEITKGKAKYTENFFVLSRVSERLSLPYYYPPDGTEDTKVLKSPDHWNYVCQNPKDKCVDFRNWSASELRKGEAMDRLDKWQPPNNIMTWRGRGPANAGNLRPSTFGFTYWESHRLFEVFSRFDCCHADQTRHAYYDDYPDLMRCYVDYINYYQKAPKFGGCDGADPNTFANKAAMLSSCDFELLESCSTSMFNYKKYLNANHHPAGTDWYTAFCADKGFFSLNHLFEAGVCGKWTHLLWQCSPDEHWYLNSPCIGGFGTVEAWREAQCCTYHPTWPRAHPRKFCPYEDGWKERCVDEWNKAVMYALTYGCHDEYGERRESTYQMTDECYMNVREPYFGGKQFKMNPHGGPDVCVPCEGKTEITAGHTKDKTFFFVPHPPTGTTIINGCPYPFEEADNYRFRYEHTTWNVSPMINWPDSTETADCDDSRIPDLYDHKYWLLTEDRKETRTHMIYSGGFEQMTGDHGREVYNTGMEIPLTDKYKGGDPWQGFFSLRDNCNILDTLPQNAVFFQKTNDPLIEGTNNGKNHVINKALTALGPFPTSSKVAVDYYTGHHYLAQSNWICIKDSFMLNLPPPPSDTKVPSRVQSMHGGGHVIHHVAPRAKEISSNYWWLRWMKDYHYIYDETYNGARIADLYFQMNNQQYEFNYGMCGILTGEAII